MKSVKFVDIWGQGSVDVPDLGKRFTAGETVSLTDEEAAKLAGNPNFQGAGDAKTQSPPSEVGFVTNPE